MEDTSFVQVFENHFYFTRKKNQFNSLLHFFWYSKSNLKTTLLKFCGLRTNDLTKNLEQRNDLALLQCLSFLLSPCNLIVILIVSGVGNVLHFLETKPSKLNFETICRNSSAASICFTF